MEITIDVSLNRWSVDGAWTQGKRRWEAALLGLLLRDKHHHASAACGEPKLQTTLAALGQAQPLNRKQIARLLDELHAAFERVGHGHSMVQRLRHGPRRRTVGPWWWSVQPGDRWSLIWAADARAPALTDLPALVDAPTASACAAFCREVLVCYGHIWDGDTAAALEGLNALANAPSASIELRAMLNMRRSEVLLSMRRLDAAHAALDEADALLHGHGPAGAYLSGHCLVLRYRLAYAESPLERYRAITEALSPLATRPPGVETPEVDVTARGALLNLLALCERRWLEENGNRVAPEHAAERMERAQRYWFAALFGYLSIGNHEYVQHMCSNLAYFYQRMSQLGVGCSTADALDWYSVARGWHNRFDLAENVVWEYIFLGDYWLYDRSVRLEFKRAANAMGWQGHRPDELEFYAHADRRAAEIGEPRQIAHTALNLFHYAHEIGNTPVAQHAKRRLRAVLNMHPDVLRILVDEGYHLP